VPNGEWVEGEEVKHTIRMMLSITAAILLSLFVVETAYPWLGVSPYRIEVDLSFGATTERTIIVTNLSDEPKLVKPSVRGLRLNSAGNLVWLSPDGENAKGIVYEYGAVGGLVEVEPAKVTLPAGSSTEFTVRIAAPEKYIEGAAAGRVGALLFTASPVGEGSQESILFQSNFRVVAFLLIRFNEHQQREVILQRTEIQQGRTSGLRFVVVLENTGNVHLYPRGQIVVRDSVSGQTVAELAISEGTLLPECERAYTAEWDRGSDLPGTYEATYSITYEGRQEGELVKTHTFTMAKGRLENEEVKEG